MYILFKVDTNWADEMDIIQYAVFSYGSAESQILLDIITHGATWNNDTPYFQRSFYVGTNQDIDGREVFENISYQIISKEEAKFFEKFSLGNSSILYDLIERYNNGFVAILREDS